MPGPVDGLDGPEREPRRFGDHRPVGDDDGDVLHPVGVDRVRHGDVVDEGHCADAVELEPAPQHARCEERPGRHHGARLLEEQAQVDERAAPELGPLEEVLPQAVGDGHVVLIGAHQRRRTLLVE